MAKATRVQYDALNLALSKTDVVKVKCIHNIESDDDTTDFEIGATYFMTGVQGSVSVFDTKDDAENDRNFIWDDVNLGNYGRWKFFKLDDEVPVVVNEELKKLTESLNKETTDVLIALYNKFTSESVIIKQLIKERTKGIL